MARASVALACAAALGAAAAGSAPAAPGGVGLYVALGDSYTSGPLIPNPKGEPVDCGRSDHNYPTLFADEIAPAEFVDVSCGSAQTKHMRQPQPDLPLGGTNPPQFDALTENVDLITIGIGGNDMGFGEIVQTCAELGAQSGGQGQPCTDHFHEGGSDQVAERLRTKVARNLALTLRGIHRRSPVGRVLMVGYPDPVPQPPGCYPEVPIAPGDLPWLHEVARRLSRTVEVEALQGGAEYVDLLTGSIGHDICQPPGTKWYEGIAPTSPAYPAHPNAMGMEFAAGEVLSAFRQPVPNAFEILRVRARNRGAIALRLQAPARGSFTVNALARAASPAKRVLRYGTATAFAERAGKLRALLRPKKRARRALRESGRLRVVLGVTYAPIGGSPITQTARTRVRARR